MNCPWGPPEGLGLVRRSERCVLLVATPSSFGGRFLVTPFLVRSIFERNAVELVPPDPEPVR